MNKHESRAREIVQRLLYLTVATASGQGQPWNSPVYAAYDEHSNFYWSSSPEAQHSRNIRENDKVFLVIYDSTVPEGKGEAVYVEATAAALEDPAEIGQAKLGLARRASNVSTEPDQSEPGPTASSPMIKGDTFGIYGSRFRSTVLKGS